MEEKLDLLQHDLMPGGRLVLVGDAAAFHGSILQSRYGLDLVHDVTCSRAHSVRSERRKRCDR